MLAETDDAAAFCSHMQAIDMPKEVQNHIDNGFFFHTFLPLAQEGPFSCTWESKEDVSVEEFQKLIDGPNGPNHGKPFLKNTVFKVPKGAGVSPGIKFLPHDKLGADSEAKPTSGAFFVVNHSFTKAMQANSGNDGHG